MQIKLDIGKNDPILKRVSLKYSMLLSWFYLAQKQVQDWGLLNFVIFVFNPYEIQ